MPLGFIVGSIVSEYSARIRAARAFKDLTQVQLAEALGVDEQTIKRRESGAQDPKKGERIAIAAICGVPAEFMENGFGELGRDELAERLGEIEATLSQIPTFDGLRLLVAESRQTTQFFKSAADAVAAQVPQADSGTRDSTDATREADQLRSEERPSTAGKHGP